jgi:hypothetical protein
MEPALGRNPALTATGAGTHCAQPAIAATDACPEGDCRVTQCGGRSPDGQDSRVGTGFSRGSVPTPRVKQWVVHSWRAAGERSGGGNAAHASRQPAPPGCSPCFPRGRASCRSSRRSGERFAGRSRRRVSRRTTLGPVATPSTSAPTRSPGGVGNSPRPISAPAGQPSVPASNSGAPLVDADSALGRGRGFLRCSNSQGLRVRPRCVFCCRVAPARKPAGATRQ